MKRPFVTNVPAGWVRQPVDPYIASYEQVCKEESFLTDMHSHTGDFLIEFVCDRCGYSFREKDYRKRRGQISDVKYRRLIRKCLHCKKQRRRIDAYWKPVVHMVPYANRLDRAVFLMEHMS